MFALRALAGLVSPRRFIFRLLRSPGLSTSGRCRYCQQKFVRSIYRPQQSVCSKAECQRQRRREYHRRKLASDEVYRQVARESQKKWRARHAEYLRQYRASHPEAVVRNRELQQVRDQKARLSFLEKNNLALDLKRSAAEVWMVGPRVAHLEKNNLASAQVFIFEQLGDRAQASTGA